jgi:Zn-dependent peptidase ImmA (M78 family)
MSRSAYYEDLKALARQEREKHGVDTARFGLAQARKIYTKLGVRIDYWPSLPSKIKALYMCADNNFSIALQKSLPEQPKLFAMMHEIKHHLTDRETLGTGAILCGDYNANQEIEIGAEVFAAEFIYPEGEFAADMKARGVATWKPEDVVRFKRDCKAKVSYTFVCKRLEWFQTIPGGAFVGVKFQKLEEEMFGVPFYKRRYGTGRKKAKLA